MALTRKEYDELESKQNTRNLILDVLVPVIASAVTYVVLSGKMIDAIDSVTGVEDERIARQEIGQILRDEGLRRCQYKDTLGNATIGVGHLVTSDAVPQCMDEQQIIDTLIDDYLYARQNVERRYPWAEDEVKLILVNMTFQLGENRLAKFTGMLGALERGDYTSATVELLDSVVHRQAPKRIERHAARILSLSDDVR